MSSYTRTLEKRILRTLGLEREKKRFEINKITGHPEIRILKKGEGNIVGSDGTSYGRQWPRVRSLGKGAFEAVAP